LGFYHAVFIDIGATFDGSRDRVHVASVDSIYKRLKFRFAGSLARGAAHLDDRRSRRVDVTKNGPVINVSLICGTPTVVKACTKFPLGR